MTVSLTALEIRALLLDIEGTTTPIEFVYGILFPYARAHVAEYLARHHDSTSCQEAVALLREERAAEVRLKPDTTYVTDVARDVAGDVAPDVAQDFRLRSHESVASFGETRRSAEGAKAVSPAQLLEYVHSLMDRDKKSPGLKALQGLVWRDGYKSGELRGRVYADVVPAFERWRARGLDIYIYSSGSVLAQQLLFRSTEAGDLTRFLHGYFDTAVGHKIAPDSYAVIAERIHVPPPEILFVSDAGSELDAAQMSGMRTALCVRGGGGAPPGSDSHPVVRSFDEIVD